MRDISLCADLTYARIYYVISISVINNCATPLICNGFIFASVSLDKIINYKMMTSDLKQGKYYAKKSISFIGCFIN